MTLARQSRKIEFDGVRYQWLVRRKPTTSEIGDHRVMHVAVERHNSKGPTLLLSVPHARQGKVFRKYSIWPSDVRRWITYALESGWSADDGSHVFKLNVPVELVRPEINDRITGDNQAPSVGDVVAFEVSSHFYHAHFSFAKVIAVDEHGVHARSFEEALSSIDEFVSSAELTLEYAHVATSHSEWQEMAARKIGVEDVSDSELIAFHQWQKNPTTYNGFGYPPSSELYH